MRTLVLNNQDISRLMTTKDYVNAVSKGYKAYNLKEAYQPQIVSFDLPDYNGELDIKSGIIDSMGVICIKVAGGFWDNPKKYNLPTGVGAILLIDANNGMPLCIADGTIITQKRTAAASALAAKTFARTNSKTLGVIGTGVQAREQTKAIFDLMDLKKICVWGIDKEEQKQYVKELTEYLGERVEIASCENPEQAVSFADIVISATASKGAIVKSEWIKPGTHINAFGCDMKGKQEWDPLLLKQSKVIVDCLSECIVRGEIQHAIRDRIITVNDIYAEIGEILLGNKPARLNEMDITFFDSTGMSVQDISSTFAVYNKAIRENIGVEVSLFKDNED